MKKFELRAYGMQELALLYFPQCTPRSASVQLKKWISHPQLAEKLKNADYHNRQKILTPRQVRLIVEHLGEP